MLRLRLPDEVLGEQAILESEDKAEEVRAVPIEGPLDPVLEDAVASQPEVRSEAGGEARQKEDTPSPKQNKAAKPLGILLAVAGGAILLLGTLAGVASGKGGNHGVPTQGGTGGSGGRSSSSLWE